MIMFVLDFGMGSILEYFFFKTNEGDFGGRINQVLKSEADIVVLGSSRAEHHYIPEILSEYTGLRVQNAGFDGQSILFQYGLFCLIIGNFTPRIVVLDLTVFDIIDDNGVSLERLSILLPFKRNSCVRSIIVNRSIFEPLKLMSKTYAFNSMALSIIKFTLFPNVEGSLKRSGYNPLFGKINLDTFRKTKRANMPSKNLRISKLKLNALLNIINIAKEKNILLVFSQSPSWAKIDKKELRSVREVFNGLIKSKKIAYIKIDRENYKGIDNMDYYKDPLHLNHRGAVLYSNIFAERLLGILNSLGMKLCSN